MANFGEQVLYKLPSKGPLSDPDGNMGTRWKEAAYLGHCVISNTYVLGCANGIEEARSIHRRTKDERRNADALANITATPWSLRERATTTVRFDVNAESEAPRQDAAPAVAKRLRLRQSDFDEHGYTEECPQCDYPIKYGRMRLGGSHSERCRD